jgi:hypothetical protein
VSPGRQFLSRPSGYGFVHSHYFICAGHSSEASPHSWACSGYCYHPSSYGLSRSLRRPSVQSGFRFIGLQWYASYLPFSLSWGNWLTIFLLGHTNGPSSGKTAPAQAAPAQGKKKRKRSKGATLNTIPSDPVPLSLIQVQPERSSKPKARQASVSSSSDQDSDSD